MKMKTCVSLFARSEPCERFVNAVPTTEKNWSKILDIGNRNLVSIYSLQSLSSSGRSLLAPRWAFLRVVHASIVADVGSLIMQSKGAVSSRTNQHTNVVFVHIQNLLLKN